MSGDHVVTLQGKRRIFVLKKKNVCFEKYISYKKTLSGKYKNNSGMGIQIHKSSVLTVSDKYS